MQPIYIDDAVATCPECGAEQTIQGYGHGIPGEFDLTCEACGHTWSWPPEPEPYEA